MGTKAVVYVRTATTDRPDDQSIQEKLAHVREYAAAHDLEVVEEHVDRNASGNSLDRPGLTRVRELASDGKIQVVILSTLTDLTRSHVDLEALESEFAGKNVGIRSVDLPGDQSVMHSMQEVGKHKQERSNA